MYQRSRNVRIHHKRLSNNLHTKHKANHTNKEYNIHHYMRRYRYLHNNDHYKAHFHKYKTSMDQARSGLGSLLVLALSVLTLLRSGPKLW